MELKILKWQKGIYIPTFIWSVLYNTIILFTDIKINIFILFPGTYKPNTAKKKFTNIYQKLWLLCWTSLPIHIDCVPDSECVIQGPRTLPVKLKCDVYQNVFKKLIFSQKIRREKLFFLENEKKTAESSMKKVNTSCLEEKATWDYLLPDVLVKESRKCRGMPPLAATIAAFLDD